MRDVELKDIAYAQGRNDYRLIISVEDNADDAAQRTRLKIHDKSHGLLHYFDGDELEKLRKFLFVTTPKTLNASDVPQDPRRQEALDRVVERELRKMDYEDEQNGVGRPLRFEWESRF